MSLGCGGDGTPLSPRGRLHLNHTLQLRHSHYLLSHDTYIQGLGGGHTGWHPEGGLFIQPSLWCQCPLLNFKLHIDIEGSREGTS